MIIKRVSDMHSSKLRCCHVSDNHGSFPNLNGSFDVVVHSGDMLPNMPISFQDFFTGRLNSVKEMTYQADWIGENISLLKKWLKGRPLLFILGNHDFINDQLIEQMLNSEGIKAISLHDKVVKFQDVTFYGFPYIPLVNGSFAYEREVPEMTNEVDKMVKELNQTKVDVLVMHAPLHKVLDLTNGNVSIGSSVISTGIDYKLDKEKKPRVICHGHCHESAGLTIYNDILVSNAATKTHIIEI